MASRTPGNSQHNPEEEVKEEVYESLLQDGSDTCQKGVDKRKRDSLTKIRASRAAINKRRLHGAQGTEVDWEDRQLCISSGQHCSEVLSSSYAQVKKPLTEVIENPTGTRKSLPFIDAGYERMPYAQIAKFKNLYGLNLFEDIMSLNRQDAEIFSQVNHSNSPKVAIKRVSSDEILNEFLGRSINKHTFNLSKSSHKGMKYKKSRENLEIRRRHSSMGGSVTGDELNHYSRRSLWRKFSNSQLGLNNNNGDLFQEADLHDELVSYDDDKDLIREKRVRRNSVGDMSFVKEDICNGEPNCFGDHFMPNKYVLVNATNLFVREDFASQLSAGEFCYNKSNNFGEEFWASGKKNSICRLNYPIDEVSDESTFGKWSDICEIRNGFSMVGRHLRCDVPFSMMPNIYPSNWGESDIFQSLTLTKSSGELKMSPIYQSQTNTHILARKSCSALPDRKWTHQRCLPKIPQLWKEERHLSSGKTIKETEEEMEPLSTSSDVALIESEETSISSGQDNKEKEDDSVKEISDEPNSARDETPDKEKTEGSTEKERLEEGTSCIPSYLPLRLSLFPFVPPYLGFGKHNRKGPPIHEDIKRIAKWKLGKFTPTIVQIIVRNTGLDIVRNCEDYVGVWSKNLTPSGFSHIKETQKINHIPGGFYIGRKDRLCNNLKKMRNIYGNSEYYFVPETYVLPGDIYFLKQEWDEAVGKKGETKWIVKPPAGARGSGVAVIHSWNQIPHSKPIIVQKYIENPYLIDMTKFDLRVYMLVTSVHPLRMYVYTEGLVRFASDIYSPDSSTLSDRYVHLTNYSVNKNSSRYMVNQDPTACQGHKWTLSCLWNYLRGRHINVDSLWKQIVDIAIKAFLSGENSIVRCVNAYVNSNYPTYELFGLDILLDAELQPWLLEVNISPSLNTSTNLDMSVKGPMLTELLNLVGYHLPQTQQLSVQGKRELVKQLMNEQLDDTDGPSTGKQSPYPGLLFDKRIYSQTLSSEEKRKQLSFNERFSNNDAYCDSILRILMPDDVRHLLLAEDELSQTERFERVFPALGMQKYYKFFSGPRYYNMLYEAWEKRYHNNRKAGIELLRELCKNRLHLRTPLSMSSLKFGAKPKPTKDLLTTRKTGRIPQTNTKDNVASKKKSKERITVKTKKFNEPSTSFSRLSAKKTRVNTSKAGSRKIRKKINMRVKVNFRPLRSSPRRKVYLK